VNAQFAERLEQRLGPDSDLALSAYRPGLTPAGSSAGPNARGATPLAAPPRATAPPSPLPAGRARRLIAQEQRVAHRRLGRAADL
jgi:hypothetical protein